MELVRRVSTVESQIVREALRRWKIVQGIFDDFRGSGFMDMGIQQQLVFTENWKT